MLCPSVQPRKRRDTIESVLCEVKHKIKHWQIVAISKFVYSGFPEIDSCILKYPQVVSQMYEFSKL